MNIPELKKLVDRAASISQELVERDSQPCNPASITAERADDSEIVFIEIAGPIHRDLGERIISLVGQLNYEEWEKGTARLQSEYDRMKERINELART